MYFLFADRHNAQTMMLESMYERAHENIRSDLKRDKNPKKEVSTFLKVSIEYLAFV